MRPFAMGRSEKHLGERDPDSCVYRTMKMNEAASSKRSHSISDLAMPTSPLPPSLETERRARMCQCVARSHFGVGLPLTGRSQFPAFSTYIARTTYYIPKSLLANLDILCHVYRRRSRSRYRHFKMRCFQAMWLPCQCALDHDHC